MTTAPSAAASADREDDTTVPGARESVRLAFATLALVWQSSRWSVLLLAAMTVVLAVVPGSVAYVGKLLIDAVVAAIESGSQESRQAALLWVGVEALILGTGLVVTRVQTYRKRVLLAQLGYTVGRRIFDKTLRMDLETIEDAQVQQQIVMARQHATARPYALITRIFDTLQYGLTLIIFSGLLAQFSLWAVAIIWLGGLPLFVGELRFAGSKFRFVTGRTSAMRRRTYLEKLMTEETAAVERLYTDASPQILGRYDRLYHLLFAEDRALQARHTLYGAILIAVSSVIFVSAAAWVVAETVAAAITLGQMTMYLTLLRQGQNHTTRLLATLNGGYEDILYVSKLFSLLAHPEGAPPGRATAGPQPGDGYRLEGVSFGYPHTTRPALEGVTLHIPPGTRLGIAGTNGSGKTTLIKLLIGLYQPKQGRITLDGLPLEDWDPQALFARSAAVFQPFQRYRLTAREAVMMGEGLRDCDDAALLLAIRAGLAEPVINELVHGLDTPLSRDFLDGRELSGGQWQRLALARAMLRRKADILILDEPTAALDPAAEEAFLSLATAGDRSVVLISHRLANLRHANQIVVLEKGRIVETGSHHSLMETNGRYRALYDKQAAAFHS